MNGVIEACKNYLGGGSARDESAGEQTITTGRILSVDERLNAHTYQLQGHDVIFPHAKAHPMGKYMPTTNCSDHYCAFCLGAEKPKKVKLDKWANASSHFANTHFSDHAPAQACFMAPKTLNERSPEYVLWEGTKYSQAVRYL